MNFPTKEAADAGLLAARQSLKRANDEREAAAKALSAAKSALNAADMGHLAACGAVWVVRLVEHYGPDRAAQLVERIAEIGFNGAPTAPIDMNLKGIPIGDDAVVYLDTLNKRTFLLSVGQDIARWAGEQRGSTPSHPRAYASEPPIITPARLTVTIAALRGRYACELPARLADLEAHLGHLPADEEPLSLLGVWMALRSTSTTDAIWALRVAEPAADAYHVAVAVAVAAARRVEHLLPAEGRAACVAAIEAAEAWLAESTPERVAAATRAAAAAADAAWAARGAAANAAWAAARTARAVDDAARFNAVDAARSAACAADAAAWATTRADLTVADAAAWATTRADLTALLAA